MKTPMQELIEEMEKSPLMYAPALILISSRKMLEKEKEVMCEFAKIWDKDLDKSLIRPAEDCFDETFNTKER